MEATTSLLASQQLRTLASFRTAPGNGVLSLYLDLDPTEFAIPKARLAEIESLADQARQRYTDDEEHRPLELDSPVARTIERVRRYLESEFDPRGARGVAIFAAADPELFEVLRLAHPVKPRVRLAERPFIRPLLEAPPGLDGWLVLMANRRTARLLAGRGLSLGEVTGFEDAVHGWHDQGGWSQARYQRHVEKQVKDHAQHACQALFEHSRREPVEHVVLASTEDVRPLIEACMHPELARRLAGHITVDIETASPTQVAEQVEPLAARHREQRDRELIEQLREGLGRMEGAAAGPDQVLDALNRRAVAVLLACPDLSGSAVTCPGCGWLGLREPRCPVDQSQTRATDDVLETMVQAALDQAAGVRLLEDQEVRGNGCAAALLRFDSTGGR